MARAMPRSKISGAFWYENNPLMPKSCCASPASSGSWRITFSARTGSAPPVLAVGRILQSLFHGEGHAVDDGESQRIRRLPVLSSRSQAGRSALLRISARDGIDAALANGKATLELRSRKASGTAQFGHRRREAGGRACRDLLFYMAERAQAPTGQLFARMESRAQTLVLKVPADTARRSRRRTGWCAIPGGDYDFSGEWDRNRGRQ